MFDFLYENGITEDVVALIIKNNSKNVVADFLCNSDNCIKIISSLRELGINNINDLLIYRIDLFMQTFNMFKKKIDNINVDEFVNLVNDDYNNIDIIY